MKMRAIKQIPRRKYEIIIDMENTFDVNLTNHSPERFIMIPTKAVL
jgi:hypothetical protein